MRPVLLLILNFNFSLGAVTKLYVMVPENARSDDHRIIELAMEIRILSPKIFKQINTKIQIVLKILFEIKLSKNNLVLKLLKLKSLEYLKTIFS